MNPGCLWCQIFHILPKNFCISCLATQGIKLNLRKQNPHLHWITSCSKLLMSFKLQGSIHSPMQPLQNVEFSLQGAIQVMVRIKWVTWRSPQTAAFCQQVVANVFCKNPVLDLQFPATFLWCGHRQKYGDSNIFLHPVSLIPFSGEAWHIILFIAGEMRSPWFTPLDSFCFQIVGEVFRLSAQVGFAALELAVEIRVSLWCAGGENT